MKLKTLIITILLVVLLSSCKTKTLEPGDLKLTVLNEVQTNDTYDIHILLPYKITDLLDLEEIANTTASITYEDFFNLFENNYYELTLYFYSSEKEYNKKNSNLGFISFYINKDYDKPGLTLKENTLRIN